MAAVPTIPIVASKRVPFDDSIAMMGVDYSGANVAMEIRPEPGGTGTAMVSLGASISGGQGLTVTYDADYPDPDGTMPDGATLVRVIINETTLEGLAYGADRADPVTLHYDIHLTPSGGKKFVFCAGTFTVTPGVTI